MLERLLLIRACRRAKGQAAGVSVAGRCMPWRIVDAGWLCLSASDIEDNTILIPWGKVDWIEFGPACEDDLRRRKRALAMAKTRRDELDSLIEEKERSANGERSSLSPDEIEEILRQFEGSPQ